VNLYEPDSSLIPDLVNHQDFVAWITQGPNAERQKEKLGESDRGIILYRKVLKEQAKIVEDGGEPMGVVRDEEINKRIDLPLERWQALSDVTWMTRYMPLQQGEPPELVSDIERVLSTWAGEKPWAQAQATLNT
jgi:5,5'-dehydrodivanillate O-demethylase